MDQAVQIVVSEIESLERRVRAFSEFASEPPVRPEVLDINALVGERVALLRPVYPGPTYQLRLDDRRPRAHAALDLVKGILTNLLQNAAEAAGPGGSVLRRTRGDDQRVLDRRARFRAGSERRRHRHAVRADDYLQEARHGSRPVDRQEERAALGRGHQAESPASSAAPAFRVTLPAR